MESKKICRIRDVYQAISALETQFERMFKLNINEIMLLCTLNEFDNLTSGEIAEKLGLTHSNASKVICSVEKDLLIKRHLDKNDKRQMRFSLTKMGAKRLADIKCDEIELPELLSKVIDA